MPPEPNEAVGNYSIQSFTLITKPGSSQPTGEILTLQPKDTSQTAQVRIGDTNQLQETLKGRYAKRGVVIQTNCQQAGVNAMKCIITYPAK